MRLDKLLGVAVLVFGVGSPGLAAETPQELLVGRWALTTEERNVVEFAANGTYSITSKDDKTATGTYVFVGRDAIQTKVGSRISTSTIMVTRDELKLTNEAGRILRFKRIR
jgi:hypothetical protein